MAALIGAASNIGFLLIALAGLAMAKNHAALSGLLEATFPANWAESLIGPDHSFWRLSMLVGAARGAVDLFYSRVRARIVALETCGGNGACGGCKGHLWPGLRARTILATCLGAIALLGTWGSVQWLPAWANKLSGGQAEAGAYTQICSALGATIGSVAAAYLAQWTNRRRTYFGLALASLLVCGYLFAPPQQFDSTFLILVLLAGCMTASFYGWLPLYLPELFPTRIRATGQGFAYNFGRVLAAAGTLASGQLLNHFGEDYAAPAP